MEDALAVHRLQFAFHRYIPLHFSATHDGAGPADPHLEDHRAAYGRRELEPARRGSGRKIFGISFALGVVTGIPMEFQFGTNWSQFSRAAGGVIGQTLAMEGVFSFFLESSFSGALSLRRKAAWPAAALVSSLMMFVGSWLSGYLIVADRRVDAAPRRLRISAPNGSFELQSYWGLLLNPWGLWQYAHTMIGAVQTGCFVMAAIGAYYLLSKQHEELRQKVRARSG